MRTSRRFSLALAFAYALVALLLLASQSEAASGNPATVTVRVEGVTETKLPLTQVTTTTEPVVKDGKAEDSCPGTSALGALQLATGGNWSGPWDASLHQYFIEAIAGEGEAVGASKDYWSFWVNDVFQETGACAVELEAGAQVLFFPICYEACPAGAEPTPLEIEAPATAIVGEPVSVTVRQYDTKGKPTPAPGAAVSAPGAHATTDAQGHASLTFASAGSYTLSVTGASGGPPAVRTETTVCVHTANDGKCGTSIQAGPSGSVTSGAVAGHSSPHPSPYTGPYAVVAQIAGLLEHHAYSRAHAPRVLAGTVTAHTAVTSVSIALRRSFHNRCSAYDALRERFAHARCGAAPFFEVSHSPSFSYLLPAALAPGRYVLDVEATDAAGNHTTLARGTSRIVFFVR
jgi:hypothetical protein